MSSQVDVHIAHAPDGTPALVVQGDLDYSGGCVLDGVVQTALEASDEDLRIDLSRLRFLDSYGVRALARARQQARQRGRKLILQQAPPRAQRLLDLLGWDDPPRLQPTG